MHAGEVVKFMGSEMDSQCDKCRGLTIEKIGKESIIHTEI